MTGNIEYYSTSDGFKPGFEWFQNNERFAYVHPYTDEAYSDKSLLIQADASIKLYSNNLEFNGKNVDTIEEQGDGYIRYSNGLQICWTNMDFGSIAAGSGIDLFWIFSKSFVNSNYIAVCGNSSTGYEWMRQSFITYNRTTTSVNVAATNNGSGTSANTLASLIAIGRWK